MSDEKISYNPSARRLADGLPRTPTRDLGSEVRLLGMKCHESEDGPGLMTLYFGSAQLRWSILAYVYADTTPPTDAQCRELVMPETDNS